MGTAVIPVFAHNPAYKKQEASKKLCFHSSNAFALIFLFSPPWLPVVPSTGKYFYPYV
jgi:hypothetical protein